MCISFTLIVLIIGIKVPIYYPFYSLVVTHCKRFMQVYFLLIAYAVLKSKSIDTLLTTEGLEAENELLMSQ